MIFKCMMFNASHLDVGVMYLSNAKSFLPSTSFLLFPLLNLLLSLIRLVEDDHLLINYLELRELICQDKYKPIKDLSTHTTDMERIFK